MKKLLVSLITMLALSGTAQILFDPTLVYDGPGELYSTNQVKTISITFYSPVYHDTLTQWWFDKNETRLPAQIDVGSDHYDSVGVKYKGNSTFYIADLLNNPKVPLNVDINEYIGGQHILGYKKLKLANAFFDPTFSKEILASSIYKNYLPTHEAALCKVYVNGIYLGVYVNTESISRQFLKKHFNEKDGSFFKCEPSAQYGSGEFFNPSDLMWRGPDTLSYIDSYERKSDSGWVDLLNFIYALNYSPSSVNQYVNIDRVLWYFAVTTVIPNDDAYNTMVMHNYYLYRTADNKFQLIPWDLSESFCGAMIGQGTPADHYEREPFYGYSPFVANHPLVSNILSDPYNRKKMLQHVRTVMEEFYDEVALKTQALDLIGSAYTAISNDNNKLFSMANVSNNVDNNIYWFTTEIAGIVETIINRKPYLVAHPEVSKIPPVITNVSQSIQHPSSTDIVYVSAEVTNATQVLLKVTNNDAPYASDFIAVIMLDDGLNGDAVAGDNIYTAAVPYTTSNDHIKYYIEAENVDALQLNPKRAEYFYYHYYVDQVVSVPLFSEVEISVYPNPAFDKVTLEFNQEQEEVVLLSLDGKLVDSYNNPVSPLELNVGDLNRGAYLIILRDKKGGQVTKQLVLN